MRIDKNSPTPATGQITTTPQAGASQAKTPATTAGRHNGVAADSYQQARVQQAGVQSTSFVKVGVKAGDLNEGRMSCCLPPPPQKLPIGNETPVAKAKREAQKLRYEYNKTVRDALGDRQITDQEQRKINSAARNLEIAETNVELEHANEAYRAARRKALKDGHIDPKEARQLAEAQAKILGLQAKLAGLKFKDMVQDVMDAVAEKLERGGGPMPFKGPQTSGKPGSPSLPDSPRTPLLDNPDPGLRWNNGRLEPMPDPAKPYPVINPEPGLRWNNGKLEPMLLIDNPDPRPGVSPLDPIQPSVRPAGVDFPALPDFPRPPLLDFRPVLAVNR
jgi:hypothetical protein